MYSTLLFVPGDSEKKIEKVISSTADVLIFDLEDSVSAANKAMARDQVVHYLQQRKHKQKIYIRINSLDSNWAQHDIAAIMPFAPDGIVLPKCHGPSDVDTLASSMTRQSGATECNAGIIAIVTETATGVLALTQGGWRHPSLEAMMWGAEDLAADIGAARNREDGHYCEPFRLARNLCLLAARAANVLAIDAVFPDFKDSEGLMSETRTAQQDGFDAKAAIHPAQLDTIATIFHPSSQDIAWAGAVIEAFADETTGIASLNGMMLDKPHLKQAQKILAKIDK
ncbi:MAG: HpcH/HpaI aldolase/citrate lyase family protein [bacterium]